MIFFFVEMHAWHLTGATRVIHVTFSWKRYVGFDGTYRCVATGINYRNKRLETERHNDTSS
jgi:hypothetical protein